MKLVNPTPISTATPVAETVGATGLAGSLGTVSDAGHRHALLGSSPQAAQILAAAANAGASGAPSRFDHAHSLGVAELALAADLVVNASTALVNVTGCSFPIAANETWEAVFYGAITNTLNGCAQFDVTGPAAPASVSIKAGSVASGPAAYQVTAFSTAFGTALGALATQFYVIHMRITNGATSGTIQLRFAQANANGVATLVAGSGGWARKAA